MTPVPEYLMLRRSTAPSVATAASIALGSDLAGGLDSCAEMPGPASSRAATQTHNCPALPILTLAEVVFTLFAKPGFTNRSSADSGTLMSTTATELPIIATCARDTPPLQLC